ncbi:MAG: twin-arginine translocation signal domain-containing protein [Bryobacterales bacterium]
MSQLRRDFLKTSSMAAGSAALPAAYDERPTVAAIITEYRYLSHADVIVTKLMEG